MGIFVFLFIVACLVAFLRDAACRESNRSNEELRKVINEQKKNFTTVQIPSPCAEYLQTNLLHPPTKKQLVDTTLAEEIAFALPDTNRHQRLMLVKEVLDYYVDLYRKNFEACEGNLKAAKELKEMVASRDVYIAQLQAILSAYGAENPGSLTVGDDFENAEDLLPKLLDKPSFIS